jgi:hypothetical protein
MGVCFYACEICHAIVSDDGGDDTVLKDRDFLQWLLHKVRMTRTVAWARAERDLKERRGCFEATPSSEDEEKEAHSSS